MKVPVPLIAACLLILMTIYQCEVCQAKFDNRRGLANHSRSKCSKKCPQVALELLNKRRHDREEQQAARLLHLQEEEARRREQEVIRQAAEVLISAQVSQKNKVWILITNLSVYRMRSLSVLQHPHLIIAHWGSLFAHDAYQSAFTMIFPLSPNHQWYVKSQQLWIMMILCPINTTSILQLLPP